MKVRISLEGKVAVVTGASKGIGKAIAAGLAEAGASVLLSSRKLEGLEKAAEEIRTSGVPGPVAVRVAHAGRLEDAIATVATAMDQFGRLDILVNNAATNPYFGPTLNVQPSQFDKTFEVNLKGPIFWARAAYDQSFATSPGVVINIASVGGLRAENGLGVYNVSKAALIHLTRQLASELGLTRVVGIAPGLVQTDFTAELINEFGEKLATTLPTRRLGLPKDVANLAVFLASDAASWITGETFVIDGGAGVRATMT
jgi:NAD(P)-dependent dehydrogenase (short-subunit alcohol dehydrogenase family)